MSYGGPMLLPLSGVLSVFLLAGVLVARFAPLAPGGATLGDLSNAEVVEIRDAEGHVALSGEFRAGTDALGNIEKDAALVGRDGRRVVGEIEVEIPGPQSAHSRQKLEIEIIRIAPLATFGVYIDGRHVTSFTADDRGSVDLEIESAAPARPPGESRPPD